MKYSISQWKNALFSGALILLATSCSHIGNFAERRADHAAYGNIRGAQQRGLGEVDDFTIDDAEGRKIRAELEQEANTNQPTLLSLSETLAIAMANSRSYQSRKESLFIEALNLTETQKRFNWDTSASSFTASSTYSDDGTHSETFGENGVDGTLNLSVGRTLVSGAKVTLGFTQGIVEYFTNPDTSSDSSTVSLNVVQPLLNGFGPLVSKEPLRQAERNMVYTVRDFKRYQQSFVIDTISLFYSTLRGRDRLTNEMKNYDSTVLNRKQTQALVDAGRRAAFDAYRAQQSELDAADSLATARADYQSSLDNFRFQLGLPIDLNAEPDPAELKALSDRGLIGLDITLEKAVNSAVSNRLDLINLRQQVKDQERRLEIARRDFLPNLDVNYGAAYDLEKSSNEGLSQDTTVSLNIPFDWTEKRNAYRIAQINLDREQRSLEEDEDSIQIEVRNLWRSLERTRLVYENRLRSVVLAERRVENTRMLLQQGKSLTTDLLDAQDALLSAQNATTLALVDYTISRLRFWNAIERFTIDPRGMWYEQVDRNAEESVGTP